MTIKWRWHARSMTLSTEIDGETIHTRWENDAFRGEINHLMMWVEKDGKASGETVSLVIKTKENLTMEEIEETVRTFAEVHGRVKSLLSKNDGQRMPRSNT